MGNDQSRSCYAESNPPPPGFSLPPGHADVRRYYFTPLYYVEELRPFGWSAEHCATIQEYTFTCGSNPKIRWGAKKMVIIQKGEEKIIDLITPPAWEKREKEVRRRYNRFMDNCPTIQESAFTFDNTLLNKYSVPDNLYDKIARQRTAISKLEDGDVHPVALGEYSAEAGSTEALAEMAGKNMKRNKELLENLTLLMRIASIFILALGLFKSLFIRPKSSFRSPFRRPKSLKVAFSEEVTVHECTVHASKPKKGVRFAVSTSIL